MAISSVASEPRCTWHLVKAHRGLSARSQKLSSWRCVLPINHGGLHEVTPVRQISPPDAVHQVAELLFDSGLFELWAEAYRMADDIVDTVLFGERP